jgi:hypothetical protein
VSGNVQQQLAIADILQAAPGTDGDCMRKELAQFTSFELALLGSQVAIVIGVVFGLYLIVTS